MSEDKDTTEVGNASEPGILVSRPYVSKQENFSNYMRLEGGGHANHYIRVVDAFTGATCSGEVHMTGAGQFFLQTYPLPAGEQRYFVWLWNGKDEWVMSSRLISFGHYVPTLGESNSSIKQLDNDDMLKGVSSRSTNAQEPADPPGVNAYHIPQFNWPQGQKIEGRQYFELTAFPGWKINIIDAATWKALSATATVNTNGKVGLTLSESLPNGIHDITAQVWDSGDWFMGSHLLRVVVLSRPVILTRVLTSLTSAEVSGNNGAPGATLHLYLQGGTVYFGRGTVDQYGNWKVIVQNLYPGLLRMTCRQVFDSRRYVDKTYSEWSEVVEVDVMPAPEFTYPSKEGRVYRGNIVVKGTGKVPFSKVQLMNGAGTINYGETEAADLDGNWSKAINLSNESLGDSSLSARHVAGGEWGNVSFKLVGLEIEQPRAGATVDQDAPISGFLDHPGAIVTVSKDLDDGFIVGQGTVQSNGRWTLVSSNVNPLPVGVFSIVARSAYNNTPGGSSSVRTFNVRPPTVELLEAVASANGTVTIKGKGHVGAEVNLHYKNNGNVLKFFTVNSASWTQIYPDWLPGNYTITARQWVMGTSNQKIYSGWAQDLSFTVKVPPPSLTHSVGLDQKPVFSGSGNAWADQPAAKVELQITGTSNPLPSMPIVNVVNNRWTNTAIAQWEPGTYSVKARQLFNNLQSEWTSQVQVVIKAPLPSIDTITENGLSPDITGTCWKGAVVTLTFSDGATIYPVSDTDKDGHWTYRRPAPFTPGTYTITATQTFNGQTSNEVIKSFSVVVPKPVIKAMEPPVGHEPIVEGSGGYVGAVMTIYNYFTNQSLGNAPVTDDGWAVLLSLEFSDYQIYARQSFNGLSSEQSEPISFKAELLAPVVNTPQPVDTVARSFRIEGIASKKIGIEVATVEVFLDEGAEPWARIRANYRGEFWLNATLPLGTHTLRFKQLIKDQESAFGEDLVFGVVPAKAVIETPADGEVVESRLAVSGFGYPGDTVSVAFADALEVILGTTQVSENGTWSLWLSLDRPAGHPSLVVQQSFENHLSGWTAPRSVELRTQPPQFSAPLPGRWVKPKPTFAGSSWADAEIELRAWFNPQISRAASRAVDNDWEATPTDDLPPNEHWVCATQSAQQSGGVTRVSASADSPRFEVMVDKDAAD
ncbi:hypothetical protein J2X66_003008 [Pseudomonas sp. 3296]|uniref:hypothetical protein n=1 Tax=Pseudomonas sp. 3296 TaxID=2817753 RepID=UPI0028556D9A|nr:hypothetical protein [Pseudomonas sp. 3296]MDR6916139.1 hypothetical protein [Pseudomonas sp. 3296]